MKKFLLYFIPILTIASFIVVMNSGYFLKGPFGDDDRLYEAITQIEQNVLEKKWEMAEENIAYSENAWKKIVRRIQYSVEKEYIIEINGILSRIRGGIKIYDDKAIIEEVYYFYEMWDKLAK
ncbi:hypothetical protein [Paraliobacillus salinarum]|uniref:hypothetical protein n=1 Tax=Paraliobacillus salinarum TaxID=1158996 RepID=UPI0015F647FD|nr:hypothetical protein [Paraliobacillus salinarum]